MISSTLAPPRPRIAKGVLHGRSLLITGCNTGIGFELAWTALAWGADLQFTCRTPEKVEATRQKLRREYPHARLRGHALELGEQSAVDAFADMLADAAIGIDALILNAGVHIPFARRTASSGAELHQQVNFLSPARLFLQLMTARHPPRHVLYVSSDAHQRGHLPDVFPISFWSRYARSKLRATTFFAAARPLYPHVTISVLSPGNVQTDVHRYKSGFVRFVRRFTGAAGSATGAAATLLDAAFQSGQPEAYRNRGVIAPMSPYCDDPKLKKQVWDEASSHRPFRTAAAHSTHVAATHVITNHAVTVSHLAPPVQTPSTEQQVSEIVCRARAAGRSVRVVASRHSYNDCFYSPSELMSLENFDEIGPINEARRTVSVGAGVTVQTLCDHLDDLGYALRWAGNSGAQTLVGAAITGTHGYGRDGGLLAELIVGARVVTGTGEILEIDDEEELSALRVSLGTLVTITSVKLSCIPSGALVRYSIDTLDESEFLARLSTLASENEYFRFFPNRYHPDRFSVLTINPTSEPVSAEDLERVRYIDKTNAPGGAVALLRLLMRSTLTHRLLRRLPAPRLRMSLIVRFSTLLFVNCGVVNRWYRIAGLVYQSWNDDETRNMELAVRPDDFGEFLRILRGVEVAFQKQTGRFATYFTGRYTGGSDRTLIGPNHMRDVIFVDVHVRKGPGAQAFLVELERQLNDALAVRPHWGKEFAMQRCHLLRAWPAGCWAAFAAAKKLYDPDNVFSNAYTQRVFGW